MCSKFVRNPLQFPLLSVGTRIRRCPEYETVHCKYAGHGHRVRRGAVEDVTTNRVSNAEVCRWGPFVRVHIVVMREHPTRAAMIFSVSVTGTLPNFHFPNSSGCCDLWRTPWNETRQKVVKPSDQSPVESPVQGGFDILSGECIFA